MPRKPTPDDLKKFKDLLLVLRREVAGDIDNLENDAFATDGERVSVRYGEVVLLNDRPIRAIPDRHRIGLMTWGPGTRMHLLDLRRLER